MPTIHVVKRFMLQDDEHKLTEYNIGRYEVDEKIATHWYVLPHLEGFAEPAPQVGTEQYAQTALQVAQAARMSEPVEAQKQQPAPSVAHNVAAKQEVRFAGKKPPEDKDPQLAKFKDPREQS